MDALEKLQTTMALMERKTIYKVINIDKILVPASFDLETDFRIDYLA